MDGSFLEVIRAAYRSADLTNAQAVKQALLYENYRGSSEALRRCLHAHPLWASLDPTRDCPGAAWLDDQPPPFRHCSSAASWQQPEGRVARLELEDRVIRLVGTPESSAQLADPGVPPQFKRSLLRDLCGRFLRQRPHLWVFRGRLDEGADLTELLLDLGLYYVLGGPDARYLLIEMDLSAARKPNWADADLAWYFDSAPDAEDRGWTRSLRTGERGFPEWITEGQHVGRDIAVPHAGAVSVPREPAPAFWDYHKNRIDAARTQRAPGPEGEP